MGDAKEAIDLTADIANHLIAMATVTKTLCGYLKTACRQTIGDASVPDAGVQCLLSIAEAVKEISDGCPDEKAQVRHMHAMRRIGMTPSGVTGAIAAHLRLVGLEAEALSAERHLADTKNHPELGPLLAKLESAK